MGQWQKAVNGQEMKRASSLQQFPQHWLTKTQLRRDSNCSDVSITWERYGFSTAAPHLGNSQSPQDCVVKGNKVCQEVLTHWHDHSYRHDQHVSAALPSCSGYFTSPFFSYSPGYKKMLPSESIKFLVIFMQAVLELYILHCKKINDIQLSCAHFKGI